MNGSIDSRCNNDNENDNYCGNHYNDTNDNSIHDNNGEEEDTNNHDDTNNNTSNDNNVSNNDNDIDEKYK